MLPVFIRLAARSFTVLPHPPLRYCCGGCCPFFYTVGARSSTVLPLPTLLLGQILPVFIRLAARSLTVLPLPHYTTVGADAARFFRIRLVRDPLPSYPLLNYCWGEGCPFFIRWCAILYGFTPSDTTVGADAARFYTVDCAILHCAIPPPYTTVGADAARFFYTVGARSFTVLPPLTILLGQTLPVFFYTVGGANLFCASPCTAPRVNATCFGAMSVDVSDDPLLCCPLHCAWDKRFLFLVR